MLGVIFLIFFLIIYLICYMLAFFLYIYLYKKNEMERFKADEKHILNINGKKGN